MPSDFAPRALCPVGSDSFVKNEWRNVKVSIQDEANRGKEHLLAGGFWNVSQSPCSQRPAYVPRILGGRKHNDRNVRPLASKFRKRLKPLHSGHFQIQYDHVEIGIVIGKSQAFARISRLKNRCVRTGVLEQSCQAVSQDRVIINNQNLHIEIPLAGPDARQASFLRHQSVVAVSITAPARRGR